MNRSLAIVTIFAAIIGLTAAAATHAHGNHPNAAKRTGECSKPSQQTERIAKHTAGFAVERFKLDGLVTHEDKVRAGRQMNHFLRWKLGGAAAVCGQYVTAGYDHFEKSYSDEAAAMMLGILQFTRQDPELTMPNWMLAYIKWRLDVATLQTVYGFLLQNLGLPEPLVVELSKKVLGQLTKPLYDAVQSAAAYVPKRFDIDNRVVLEAIEGKKRGRRGSTILAREWSQKTTAPAAGRAGAPTTRGLGTKTGTKPPVKTAPVDCRRLGTCGEAPGGQDDRGRGTSPEPDEADNSNENEDSNFNQGNGPNLYDTGESETEPFDSGSSGSFNEEMPPEGAQEPERLKGDIPWYEK